MPDFCLRQRKGKNLEITGGEKGKLNPISRKKEKKRAVNAFHVTKVLREIVQEKKREEDGQMLSIERRKRRAFKERNLKGRRAERDFTISFLTKNRIDTNCGSSVQERNAR